MCAIVPEYRLRPYEEKYGSGYKESEENKNSEQVKEQETIARMFLFLAGFHGAIDSADAEDHEDSGPDIEPNQCVVDKLSSGVANDFFLLDVGVDGD